MIHVGNQPTVGPGTARRPRSSTG